MLPEFRIAKEASIISCPINFQQDLKKMGDIPSRPGAVKGFICFRANSTSSAVKFRINSEFILGVTLVSIPYRIWSKLVGDEDVNIC